MTDAAVRIRQLEDRIVDLETTFGLRGDITRWAKLGLTPMEARCMNVLMGCEVVTADALAEACYGVTMSEHAVETTRIRVANMKRKLRPQGINVETMWSYGHWLTPETKQKVEALLSGSYVATCETSA